MSTIRPRLVGALFGALAAFGLAGVGFASAQEAPTTDPPTTQAPSTQAPDEAPANPGGRDGCHHGDGDSGATEGSSQNTSINF